MLGKHLLIFFNEVVLGGYLSTKGMLQMVIGLYTRKRHGQCSKSAEDRLSIGWAINSDG